jgi:hypothetical protein
MKAFARSLAATTAASFLGFALAPASAQTGPASVDAAKKAALDAYLYGYSLVTSEVTRVQMSNVSKPVGLKAPMGMFINVPRYPPANFRGVSAPNADTLYSLAWLDVTEPVVFSHPDMGERFYLFEMVDLWMTVIKTPGSRIEGGAARRYFLTGPGWKGEVPAGMSHIASPTRYLVILGRTFADGTEADFKTVNALQAQFSITPLASYGKDVVNTAPPINPNPGFSLTDKPQDVLLGLDTSAYFSMMANLMCRDAPPAAADAAMVATMASLGIVACQPFDMAKLAPAVQEALVTLPKDALNVIEANKLSLGEVVNGWIISKALGRYGTDYRKRAVVAAYGWPANLEEDAVYPYTQVDSKGVALTGANSYTMTFAKGQTPPVDGFWSLTMYMVDRGWWFVPNTLNKFTISPRDKLKTNPDGSISIYIQKESPGADKEANWLPAPEGEFIPMIRMYAPAQKSPSVLDGTWTPPPVVKAD